MEAGSEYREWAPPAALSHAVACLWVRVVRGRDGDHRLVVLPDGCSDLIWQVNRGAFVAGPDTGPWPSSHPAGAVMFGVRFLPGAGGPALRTPLSELRNLRVDLGDLAPALSRALPDSLPPGEARSRLVQVAAAMIDEGPPDPIVQDVARRLADPTARVAALADELAISERQLRRQCHGAVGYGPKTLQRVLRFRRFLAAAATTEAGQRDLARLAVSAGYADQAHLTRECNALAGTTPRQLLQNA